MITVSDEQRAKLADFLNAFKADPFSTGASKVERLLEIVARASPITNTEATGDDVGLNGFVMPKVIWLHDLGCGEITWCENRDPDGEQIEAVKYVRADVATLSPNGVSQSAVERAALIETLNGRKDQSFDGECHLTNEEADRIAGALATQPASDTGLREALNRAQADLAYIERMPTHGMDDQSYINAMRRNIGEAMQRIRAALATQPASDGGSNG